MKCLMCGKDGCTYDNNTSMWYCEKCNNMFTEKEYRKQGHVSIFFLLMISILMFIPFLNIIILFMITNSMIDDKYKNVYVSIVLSQLAIIVILFLNSAVVKKLDIIKEKKDAFVTLMNDKLQMFKDVPEPYYEIKYNISLEDIVKNNKADVVEEIVEEPIMVNYDFFSGSIIEGNKLLSIIEEYINEPVVYLVQTNATRNKHGEEIYRNYGLRLDETEEGSTKEVLYFSLGSKYKLWKGDYEEIQVLPTDDIYKKKYISYVSKDSKFKYEFIAIEDYYVFIFTEQED